MCNILARSSLLIYCGMYPPAANALKEWYAELKDNEFANFHELKAVFGNASIISDDRVVFNIMGNRYRLVVRDVFEYKVIQIKWFGTHAEYDKVNAATIQFQKP
ncbi:type II toxin-antitoxin system HigB family toxin [Larkinella soli]|uniref:type II toxin-antitoxin system HigB family toxin n=1 Tax=Larkinella soli TaxID=1770527 RepID=UPI000FFB13C7|nr:type II toxin-antitoxin system HigB family toxin [Larkinella soli]